MSEVQNDPNLLKRIVTGDESRSYGLSPEHVRPPSPWTSSASFPNASVPHGRGVRPPAAVHPTHVSAPFPFETQRQTHCILHTASYSDVCVLYPVLQSQL
ncbi:hypothetical protein ANN_08756 [Periplaneta americana]|uniref:Uncharacterized protein n=1 Tax=Periplaneta americana TaxID=6978 RepID=A0ABQ8T4L0_PERAM|nr:hypothetical protein ANN_08756 [Periplaneta americana]